jgi:protein SCO1
MNTNYFTILLISILIIHCGSNEKTYPAYGVIHEVFPDKQEMLIHHDEIPGFMMAMTMRLKVDSSIQIDEWSRGDSINFEIVIAENIGFIRSFTRLGKVVISEQEDEFWEDEDSPIKIGGFLPDATFLNLDSTEISLSKNNGKHRFISFVFSRCPMPNMCPALMMKYRYLASELKNIDNLEFVTISFDYIYDYPSTLIKHYGGIIEPFPNWNLWSSFGHSSDMISFAHFSQFAFWGVEDNDIGHSMRSILISPELKLLKTWDGADWKAVNVKKDIEKILPLYQ